MGRNRVLIIGASGMLGHTVFHYLEKINKYEMTNLVFRNRLNDSSVRCDVKNSTELEQLICTIRPDVLVNCVGALVQESQNNPANAIFLNAYLPHFLRNVCDKNGIKLIHISTDCVFTGSKGAYQETDVCDAIDVYGRSKALGEIISKRHCTLRTSIIGPELKNGSGLYNWFMQQKSEITGFSRAYWGGVTTYELAKAINKVIENKLEGLYHVTNGEKISKYDLLLMLNGFRKYPVKIKMDSSFDIDKSLCKSTRFNFAVPSYAEMISEMTQVIKETQKYNYEVL